ncbi:MAG: CemA family protein [Leptolyngbya sp. SIOISBB]|nr:CemA family protein [Leptolyngbya sp. SIOISBB]
MEFRDASAQVLNWFSQRREKALNAAYEGALTIRKLEDELFAGQKIGESADKSKTVIDYACSLRDRQLLKIRLNLTQFKANSFLFESQTAEPEARDTATLSETEPAATDEEAQRQPVLDKLEFIESVIAKYRGEGNLANFFAVDEALMSATDAGEPRPARDLTLDMPALEMDSDRQREKLLPRLRSPNKESTAEYEQQIIDTLRLQRKQTRIALRWLAVLLIIPLSVQILTKNLIFEPLLGTYSDRNPTEIALNEEIQDEFARDYLFAKEKLEVATLLGYYDDMDDERRQEYLQEAAFDIWREAREEELNGLKNLLADLLAFLSVVVLFLIGRRQVTLIRTVSSRTFINLRDPVKVFLFILVTDIFVGFHSAEGWEVILVATFQHFGVPENQFFINGFIATVPVIIDACIKFWIFNFLTRYSPATSAIYERMNT